LIIKKNYFTKKNIKKYKKKKKMRTAALFLIVLIVCGNATSLFDKYPMNFSPKRSIMTLLTQVEAKLKAGGPLDAITRMLDEFVTEVTEEQVQHDELYATQQRECADEFSFRESEIAQASSALSEAQETLDGCNSQKVRAEQDYEVTKRQLAENRNFLALVEDTRIREAYAFETKRGVYDVTGRAIEEALTILEEIWAGEASFLQLTKHVNGMLKNAVKIRKVHHLTGLMSALAQLAAKDTQADEALLERVKTLLNNYRDKIEQEFQEAAAAEQAAIEAYNEDKNRLVTTIDHLTNQKQGLEEELQELEKCIVVQTGIVMSASAKRDRNQRLLDDARALCQAVTDEYTAATSARREELDLLAVIRERVEARFGQLSEGVKERGVQDEFTYTNNYAYEQPQFQASN
jgi:predicted  nucleic acid-binding Zn-ribbon protein